MGSVNIMGQAKSRTYSPPHCHHSDVFADPATVNIIRGSDKIKCVSLVQTHAQSMTPPRGLAAHLDRVYIAPLTFDSDDKPAEMGTSKRSFCTECSSMLWNFHDEWPEVSSLLICGVDTYEMLRAD